MSTLEDVDLSNARGVLVHIVAGMDFAWDEYETVGDALREFASEDSQIIIGVTVDPTIDSADLHVTVIVTGLGERKSDLTVVKNPTLISEPIVANDDAIDHIAMEEATTGKIVAEEVSEAKKPEGSYLDIPAFLRKQAD